MVRQPSEGLIEDLKSVPGRRYVKTLVPLTVLFALVFLLAHRLVLADARTQLLHEEASLLEGLVRRAERGLELAMSELRIVADLAAQTSENESPDGLGILDRTLLALVDRRPGYLRIRYVTASGHERLRVERTAAGAGLTSDRELHNEGGNDPPGDAISIGEAELRISPAGAFVQIAVPVVAASGRHLGVVALDMPPRHLLGALAHQETPGESGVRRMIVRVDGSWGLRASAAQAGEERPAREGGFPSEFPEVWPQLLATPESWVEADDGYFRLEAMTAPAAGTKPAEQADGSPVWMLVTQVPSRLIDGLALEVATSMLVVATPLFYALLAIGCVRVAHLHRKEETLRGLEMARGAMMTSALDGIVVMADSGTALEFNPSALRIFGYTADEVRGRPVAELIIPEAHRETHRKGLKRYLATGEAHIVGRHIDELTAVRKNGEVFPIELTVCRPISLGRRRVFYGFLRDLTEQRRGRIEPAPEDTEASAAREAV